MGVAPRRAGLAFSAAAVASLLVAACGGASVGSTGNTSTSGASGAGSSPGGGSAASGAIPQGATAADQLKALKGCQPTAPGDKVHWLVDSSGALPKYAVPTGSPKVGDSLAGWPTKPMIVMGDCQNVEA